MGLTDPHVSIDKGDDPEGYMLPVLAVSGTRQMTEFEKQTWLAERDRARRWQEHAKAFKD